MSTLRSFALTFASCCSVLAPASLIAQTPAADDNSSEIAATSTANPAMWQVSDEDSVYTFIGTFHILPPSLEWRTPTLAQAMDEAETVYFEVDTDSAQAQSKTLGVIMSEGFLPAGTTLSDILDEQDFKTLEAITNSLNLPLAGIDPMRPWNAFLTLSVQFIIQQGFEPGAGVDTVLEAEAKTKGKSIKYFETVDEQLGFFTGLDSQVETDLLLLTIRDWEAQKAAFDGLFNAWVNGDAETIDRDMNATMRAEAPEVFNKLIVERNQRWVDRLDAEMTDGAGTALIAVGAGHLVGGEYSVPELMRARGYEVIRLGGQLEDSVSAAPTQESEEIVTDPNAIPDTGTTEEIQIQDPSQSPAANDNFSPSVPDEKADTTTRAESEQPTELEPGSEIGGLDELTNEKVQTENYDKTFEEFIDELTSE